MTKPGVEPLPQGQVRRRPIVAGLLSLVVAGAGQLYNGQWPKALAFYLASAVTAVLLLGGVTSRTFWGWLLTVALAIVVRIATVVDAAAVAWRSRIVPAHRFSSWLVLAPTAIALAVLPTLFISLQVVKTFYLPSESMAPTLLLGDRVVAELGYYDGHPLAVGDLVIFRSPEDPSVEVAKRVVALPGDRVEIREQVLLVNGERMREPWAVHRDTSRRGVTSLALTARDNLRPLVVPKGAFFALGDNRDFSYDSRFFGPVPIENVRGKLLFIYWSADRGRIGRTL